MTFILLCILLSINERKVWQVHTKELDGEGLQLVIV